jgi:hypothetical protein
MCGAVVCLTQVCVDLLDKQVYWQQPEGSTGMGLCTGAAVQTSKICNNTTMVLCGAG